MKQTSENALDILRRSADAGLELGMSATGGQLEIVSHMPTWALEPTDPEALSAHQADAHHHDHKVHAEHNHIHGRTHGKELNTAPAAAEALFTAERALTKVEGVQGKAVEVSGFHPVEVRIRDLLTTRGLLSRILLRPTQFGFLPVTIMPDMQRPGRGVKIITFNEPYDVSPENTKGIDEGKLFALALDTMTKSEAGFGGHAKDRVNPFEGGHLTIGALASRDLEVNNLLQRKGHDGTHMVINGSVVSDLDRNDLSSNCMPKPTITAIEDIGRAPETHAIKLYWRNNLIGNDGKPLRAVHPEVSTVVVGDMISQLGSQGLDRVGNYVLMASGAR